MSTLQENIAELTALKNKFRQFIHGGLTVDISTDSGLWPSIPKAIHEATASATLEIAGLKDQAETAASQSAQHSSNSATSAEAAKHALAKIKGQSASATTLAAGESATAEYNPTTGNISFGIPLGDKGEKGDRGLKGAKGDKGLDSIVPGPQGEQGIKGDRGEKGETGDKGLDSTIAGPQGEQGIKGDRGEKGEKGDKGLDSTVAGPQGEQGIKGERGDKGEKGDTFSVDAIGTRAQRDAYDSEIKGYSFFSTDEKLLYFRLAVPGWSDGVPFGQGEKGDRGEQGIQGIAGTAGADSTVPGPKGDKGDAGSDASVTKVAVESVLIGEIDSHAHAIESVNGLPEALASKLSSSGVADNLTTTDADQVLSANQGVVLKGLIDNMAAVIASDDVSLDQLTEIVAYIKANRSTIDSLGITGVAGLRSELDIIIANVASVQSALALKADKSELQNSSSTFTTPTALTVLSGATAVSSLPELSASAYRNAFSEPRTSRRFQIDLAAGDFSSPVYEFAGDVDSHTVSSRLGNEVAYIWRCRDETVIENSDWSEHQNFTTDEAYINAPTISVEGAPSSLEERPTINLGGFSVYNGSDTHQSTDWQILENGVVIYQLLESSSLRTLKLPKGVLDPSSTYTFKARFKGASLGYSEYVEVSVSTVPRFEVLPLVARALAQAPWLKILKQDVHVLAELPGAPSLSRKPKAMKFSPDGRFLAVVVSNVLYLYRRSIDTYAQLPALAGYTTNAGVDDIQFSSDSNYLCVGLINSPYMRVYSISGNAFNLVNVPTPNRRQLYVSISNNGLVVAGVAYQNASMYLYIYRKTGATYGAVFSGTSIGGNGYSGTRVDVSPNGNQICVSKVHSEKARIYYWNGSTYTMLSSYPSGWPLDTDYVLTIKFSHDGSNIAMTLSDGSLRVFRVSGNTFYHVATYAGQYREFSWRKDSAYIVAATTTGTVLIKRNSTTSFSLLSASGNTDVANYDTFVSFGGDE